MAKLTTEDELELQKILAETGDSDFCRALLRELKNADDAKADAIREMLRAATSFRQWRKDFEAEHGATMEEAVLELIEDGGYEDTVNQVIAARESILSELPADSEAAKILRAELEKYTAAISRKGRR